MSEFGWMGNIANDRDVSSVNVGPKVIGGKEVLNNINNTLFNNVLETLKKN